MQSPAKNLTKTSPSDPLPQILLSVATGPVLLGIVGIRLVSQWLQELGQSSEEVFRGDRLPLLHLPHINQESNQVNQTDQSASQD